MSSQQHFCFRSPLRLGIRLLPPFCELYRWHLCSHEPCQSPDPVLIGPLLTSSCIHPRASRAAEGRARATCCHLFLTPNTSMDKWMNFQIFIAFITVYNQQSLLPHVGSPRVEHLGEYQHMIPEECFSNRRSPQDTRGDICRNFGQSQLRTCIVISIHRG